MRLRTRHRRTEIVPRDGTELVGDIQNDTLGALGPEPGHPGESCDVLRGDGAPERVGGVNGQHRQRQLGPDPLGAHEGAEAVPLIDVGESEQRQ